MPTIEFNLTQHTLDLEQAIVTFIKTEFNQEMISIKEDINDAAHKDASFLINVGIVIAAVASFEGTLQFAERIKRLERVKKLVAAIKQNGQAVYLKIAGKDPVDLADKTSDEIMDLLADETADKK